MEITLELIVFTVLAVFTAVSAVLAVTTKRIPVSYTHLIIAPAAASSCTSGVKETVPA